MKMSHQEDSEKCERERRQAFIQYFSQIVAKLEIVLSPNRRKNGKFMSSHDLHHDLQRDLETQNE